MKKGTILLMADRAIEAQIIESFLEAADYTVRNFSGLPVSAESRSRAAVDAAVIVLDAPEANLAHTVHMVRSLAQIPDLPIVAVLSHAAADSMRNVRKMQRPIRLFDLADVVEQSLANNQHYYFETVKKKLMPRSTGYSHNVYNHNHQHG